MSLKWLLFAALVSVLASVTIGRVARATEPPDYKVAFSFTAFGLAGPVVIASSPREPIAIPLPPSIDDWWCELRPRVSRGDIARQALVCTHDGVEVGIGVSCPTDDTGSDDESFWLRAAEPGERGVIFTGHCESTQDVDDGF